MSNTIQVTPAALSDARARVAATVEDLRAGLASADSDVEGLLSSGWSGPAAAAFRESWHHWRSGSEQVVAALERTGHLLMAGAQEYRTQEDRTRASLRQATS